MEEKDDSVRSLLEDAWKESTTDETPTESTPEPVEATEETAAPEETSEKPVEAESSDKTDEKPEDEKPLDPPNRWTKAQKKWFAGLDRNFQAQLIEHDKGIQADYTRKTQDMAVARQRYEGLEAALEPRREQFQRFGWDDATAVENVMKYWDFASADPLSFIQYFAQERGIDLAQYFAPSAEEIAQYVQSQQGYVDEEGNYVKPQAPQQDPAVMNQLQQLAQQNQMLQQQIQQHNQYIGQYQQSQEERFRTETQTEIERFANETDESGRLKHEFFDEVRMDMSRLLRADMAEDLHDAYEKAISLRPDVRERIAETQSIAQAAAEERKRVEEAERAKRAALSISGDSAVSAKSAPGDDSNLSVRDIIQAEWQRQMSGSRV